MRQQGVSEGEQKRRNFVRYFPTANLLIQTCILRILIGTKNNTIRIECTSVNTIIQFHCNEPHSCELMSTDLDLAFESKIWKISLPSVPRIISQQTAGETQISVCGREPGGRLGSLQAASSDCKKGRTRATTRTCDDSTGDSAPDVGLPGAPKRERLGVSRGLFVPVVIAFTFVRPGVCNFEINILSTSKASETSETIPLAVARKVVKKHWRQHLRYSDCHQQRVATSLSA